MPIRRLGVLLGALIAMSIVTSGCAATLSSSRGPNPNSTPTSNPNKGKSSVETLTPASVEIPANLDAEQLAKLIVEDRLSAWTTAGMNDPGVYKAFENRTSAVNTDFTDKVAAKNSAVYKTMFVDHDPSSPLASVIDLYTKENSTLLDDWLITYKSRDPADKKVYTTSLTYDTGTANLVPDASQSTEELTFDATSHNNSAENRIGTYYDPAQIANNGEKLHGKVTFTKVGDKLEISSMDLQEE